MFETKENILHKLIKATNRITPEELSNQVASYFKHQDAVGIVEAVSQVFWVVVKTGQIIPMSDANPGQSHPAKWLTARFFNEEMELRFLRENNEFLMTCISDKDVELTGDNYRDTQWLLSGKKVAQQGIEQEMSEFQVAAYRMPLTAGEKTPCLKVRQYIDYETESGLAKIVAERFINIGEEENNV